MSEETVAQNAEEVDLGYVREVLDHYADARGAVIVILQKVQVHYGYLPRVALDLISRTIRMPLAHLVGVASFYAQFRMTPRGKYMMKICCGTACHVKGSVKVVEKALETLEIADGETTRDKLFTMERVACIGACSLAPLITVNDEAMAHMDADKLGELIDDLREQNKLEETPYPPSVPMEH